MKTITISFILLVLLGFISCKTTEEGDPETLSKSYVQRFIKVHSFTGTYQKDCHAIQISVKGDEVRNQESAEFIELINHFGDNTYNKKFPPGGPNVAIANEFEGIEIISDKDFSNDLTSGKSLASVVKLYSLSPVKFIKNKYSEPFDWSKNQPHEFKKGIWSEYAGIVADEPGYYPVLKMVSEITPSDMVLLYPKDFYLRFMELPAIKEHTFKITLKNGTNSISADILVVFE